MGPPTSEPSASKLPPWIARHLTPERERFLEFGLVGASGVVVNLAFGWVGMMLFDPANETTQKALASALGIAVSVFTKFICNDVWTWGDRAKGKRKRTRDFAARVLRYCMASAVAVARQYGVAMGLAMGADGNRYLAQLIGVALGTMANCVIDDVWTFKDHEGG